MSLSAAGISNLGLSPISKVIRHMSGIVSSSTSTTTSTSISSSSPQFHTNTLQLITDKLSSIENIHHAIAEPSSCNQIIDALNLMNEVTLSDLDLDNSYIEKLKVGQAITILETNLFDITAFLLPKGFVLPLHDHPSMAVCTKMIKGSARIRSFSRNHTIDESSFQARLDFNSIKSEESESWFLTPSGGNFHQILPLTPCVMLDILLPPYNEDDRPCTFYSAKSESPDGKTWILSQLSEQCVNLPRNIPYHGFKPII